MYSIQSVSLNMKEQAMSLLQGHTVYKAVLFPWLVLHVTKYSVAIIWLVYSRVHSLNEVLSRTAWSVAWLWGLSWLLIDAEDPVHPLVWVPVLCKNKESWQRTEHTHSFFSLLWLWLNVCVCLKSGFMQCWGIKARALCSLGTQSAPGVDRLWMPWDLISGCL